MKVFFQIMLLALTAMIFVSCATAPQVKVWRPWTRVIETEPLIPVGSRIAVSVEGVTEPLSGENRLQDKEIGDKLEKYLIRRGFELDKTNYSFIVKFRFKTERRDKTVASNYMSTYSRNFNLNYNGSRSGSSYGLSAAIAQSISALSTGTSTTAIITMENVKFFTHAVTMEIFDRTGNIVWTGESNWDSPNLNIITDSDLAVQLLIVNLPKNEGKKPVITKLQPEKVENFYALYCMLNWFSSPALPYKIVFENNIYSTGIPNSRVSDPVYLPAYVDLMSTAEDAIPVGDFANYKKPMNREMWNKVLLGSIYKDSKTDAEYKVLIKLAGTMDGYVVDKCWVADDKEYSDYEAKLKIWKDALYDYYDVYEK